MKKFVSFLVIFISCIMVSGRFSQVTAQNTKRQAVSSSKVSGTNRKATSNISSRRSVATNTSTSLTDNSFETCMDNICKSSSAEDKGRCRCSSQLSRIEKVLRNIEEIQNQADEENKLLETLMNVSNSALITDTVGSVYNNINSIEKKSKTLASQKVDSNLLVMEGLPLYEEGLKQCNSYVSSLSNNDKEVKIKEYSKLIEGDCASYTTVLKEKADSAKNLLVQAQKNREMFDKQEYGKLNQLDTNACYVEYEACAKTECGINFVNCKDRAKQETVLKKCQAVNYGKCEDNKVTILADVRKYIANELEKVKLADSCKSALGHLVEGKCLFKVKYIADKCSGSKKGCGSEQEVMALPGQKFICEDKRGSFKELVSGCYESCYLIGPNEEKIYKGTNYGVSAGGVAGAIFTFGITAAAGVAQCKEHLDTFTTPSAPEGWGSDGYPLNPDLRGTF